MVLPPGLTLLDLKQHYADREIEQELLDYAYSRKDFKNIFKHTLNFSLFLQTFLDGNLSWTHVWSHRRPHFQFLQSIPGATNIRRHILSYWNPFNIMFN